MNHLLPAICTCLALNQCTTQCDWVLVAGAATKANAGLNGAADNFMAAHHHQPGASSATTMPAAARSPQAPSVPPVSPPRPAMHAAGDASRGIGRTIAEDPVAYGAAAGHAEPPPAGASQMLASDAERVAGALSHPPAVNAVKPDAELDAPAVLTNHGSQAAPAGGVSAGGQEPHASSDLSQALDGPPPSVCAPSQSRHAVSPLPPPQPASPPQPAQAAQGVTPNSTAASKPEQLPPRTLTTPLAGAHAAARPPHSANPEAVPIKRKPRERRVPSSPFGRVMGFAGLGASLVAGTVRDSVAGYFQPRPADGEQPVSAVSATGSSTASCPDKCFRQLCTSTFACLTTARHLPDTTSGMQVMSEANAERLANALCRMRGAALKLGQVLRVGSLRSCVGASLSLSVLVGFDIVAASALCRCR